MAGAVELRYASAAQRSPVHAHQPMLHPHMHGEYLTKLHHIDLPSTCVSISTGCHVAATARSVRNSSSSSITRTQLHKQQWRKWQRQSSQVTDSAAAVNLSGPGLPLLLGLKQLPSGAESLVGWQVLLSGNHALVGTVRQVQRIQHAYHLLRVHKHSILQPYGFKGRELHNIPLVSDIVDKLFPQNRAITITPPTGLLDLGRRELLLSFLSSELLQYTTHLPAPASAEGQPLSTIRCMPTQQQLVKAGRSDLVGLIGDVGGFTEAALLLGLRATRRPAGYWDSLEVLDAELDAFIAGSWVALPVASDEEMGDDRTATAQQYYFYNMASRDIRWKLPAAAAALLPTAANTVVTTNNNSDSNNPTQESPDNHQVQDNRGDAGKVNPDLDLADPDNLGRNTQQQQQQQQQRGNLSSRAVQRLLISLVGKRVMPSRSAITAAGRWDLDTAIRHVGGYREVAHLLNRRPSWPVPQTLTNLKALAKTLAEVAAEQGWDAGVLPTMRQLVDIGRQDIIQALVYHGGWRAAAELLNIRCRRNWHQSTAAATVHSTAAAVLEFMVEHQPPSRRSGSSSSSGKQSNGSGRIAHGSLGHTRLGLQRHAAAAADPAEPHQWTQLPTQRQLLAAGRTDIVCGLKKHGYDAVRLTVGLPQPTRKKLKKGVLQWEAVRAAVLAGCHTAPDILAHITQQAAAQAQQAQQHTPHHAELQQRQAQQQNNSQQQQRESSEHVVPLVAREHLIRQLKVWCDQGWLEKRRRGHYVLTDPTD